MLHRMLPAPIRALRWRLPWMRGTPAWDRAPLAALARAARFTLAELRGEDFAFETPEGLSFRTMPNNFSSFAMCVAGERDPEMSRLIARHLPEGGVFVDAGANVGAYSLPAAQRVGRGGRVISFEAHPRTHALLAANVAANGLDWVTPLHMALGEAEGVIAMAYEDRNPGETHVAEAGAAGVEVRLRRLDDALAELGVGAVDYLKVDVEGFELPVLRGAAGTIAASPRIAVQTELIGRHASRYGHSIAEIETLLRGLGLRPHRVSPQGELSPLEGELLGDVVWAR